MFVGWGRRLDESFVVSPASATDHALCAQRLVWIFLDAAPEQVEVVEGPNVQMSKEGFIPDIVVGRAEPIVSWAVVLRSDDVFMAVGIVSTGYRKRDHLVKPLSYLLAVLLRPSVPVLHEVSGAVRS